MTHVTNFLRRAFAEKMEVLILEVFFRHKPRHRNYVEYNMK
jgi:hypothetical protein